MKRMHDFLSFFLLSILHFYFSNTVTLRTETLNMNFENFEEGLDFLINPPPMTEFKIVKIFLEQNTLHLLKRRFIFSFAFQLELHPESEKYKIYFSEPQSSLFFKGNISIFSAILQIQSTLNSAMTFSGIGAVHLKVNCSLRIEEFFLKGKFIYCQFS